MSLNGKVAIVTGSARGLGAAFAEAVLEAGGRVAVSDVLEEEGRQTVEGMERRFGKGKVGGMFTAQLFLLSVLLTAAAATLAAAVTKLKSSFVPAPEIGYCFSPFDA